MTELSLLSAWRLHAPTVTTTWKTTVRMAAAGAAALGVLTACGGQSSTSTPASSGTKPPATATSSGAAGAVAAAQAPVPVESNPPGDIPDNVAFIAYQNRAAGYRFTHPEGWAVTEQGPQVTISEKLNGIQAGTADFPSVLTVAGVQQQEVPRLQRTQPAFELKSVEAVTLPAGPAVHVVYRRNSAPDPVTGRQFRDEVESYLVGAGGRHVRLDLFGAVGSDNVDAYRTISQSLQLS